MSSPELTTSKMSSSYLTNPCLLLQGKCAPGVAPPDEGERRRVERLAFPPLPNAHGSTVLCLSSPHVHASASGSLSHLSAPLTSARTVVVLLRTSARQCTCTQHPTHGTDSAHGTRHTHTGSHRGAASEGRPRAALLLLDEPREESLVIYTAVLGEEVEE